MAVIDHITTNNSATYEIQDTEARTKSNNLESTNYTDIGGGFADGNTLLVKTDNGMKKGFLNNFANWILDKLATKVYNQLTTSNKTMIGALNELNSKRLIGRINHGQTKEITFDNNYGCLMFVYHPYFGAGLYGFCAYNNTDVTLVTTILEQPQNSISISLKGRTLKITSEKDITFCIFKSIFIK